MLVFFYIVLFLIFVYYNTPVAGGAPNGNWQSGFQDPATPIMEGIIYLNNQLMFLMILISCFIGWLLFQTLKFYSDFDFHWGVSVENRNKKYSSRVYGKSTHSTMLEIIWTISPAVLLMFIGLPSFSLLYSMDETVDPAITLKVIGHQWYWSYEYSDYVSQKVMGSKSNHLVKSSNTHIQSIDTLKLKGKDYVNSSFYVANQDMVGLLRSKLVSLVVQTEIVSFASLGFFEVLVENCIRKNGSKSSFLHETFKGLMVSLGDLEIYYKTVDYIDKIMLGFLKVDLLYSHLCAGERRMKVLSNVLNNYLFDSGKGKSFEKVSNFIKFEVKFYNEQLHKDYGKKVSVIKTGIPVKTKGIKFDSYLVPEEDLSIPKLYCTGKVGKVLRLLEVDNRVVLPIYTHIRVLVTGADVLHSWAIPSLGIKVDSCPGRLNQIFLFLKRDGVFYGQCSEICGVNHGFMPIVVKGVALEEYSAWISQRLKNC